MLILETLILLKLLPLQWSVAFIDFFFSIIITMYIDSLVTNKLKIKVNKRRQHMTQNLQKAYKACCKFCT